MSGEGARATPRAGGGLAGRANCAARPGPASGTKKLVIKNLNGKLGPLVHASIALAVVTVIVTGSNASLSLSSHEQ